MSNRECNFCMYERTRKRAQKKGMDLIMKQVGDATEVYLKHKGGNLQWKMTLFGIGSKCGC